MPKIIYVEKNFRKGTLNLIETANMIIEDYFVQGFDLTLRQLYYQMVARSHIENSQKSYKNFGSTIADARLAGLIDWTRIVDRTRNLQSNPHWQNPQGIMQAVINSYQIDKWSNQPYRIECWVEKEALIGVVASVCNRLDVPYFACRGYNSHSEAWLASQRFQRYVALGQTPIILHLGDHDPSGLDMTRDTINRMELFMGGLKVERLALNWDQVQQYNPPPNPAKETDSRFAEYQTQYGDSSWELDALDPTVIVALIEEAVLNYQDNNLWDEALQKEKAGLTELSNVTANWRNVVDYLEELDRNAMW